MLVYGDFMANLSRDKTFFTDKQNFFAVPLKTHADALMFAKNKQYDYIATNKLLIETEFKQLKAALEKQENNSQAHWLYCYACCMMLQKYYTIYEKKAVAKAYLEARKNILAQLELSATDRASLNQEIDREINDLANQSITATAVRQFLGKTNLQRLVFTFGRLTIRQTLQLAKDLNWLESLDNLIGTHTDVGSMTSILDNSAVFFNLFSVGLFASRFVINLGMIAKHTFAPNGEEARLSRKERFLKELYDRHYYLLNDLAWGVVNLLSNYNQLFDLSNTFANWLTAGFLLFDLSLLLVEFYIAEKEYATKKNQYQSELATYQSLIKSAGKTEKEIKQYNENCRILNQQLVELELQRQNMVGTLWCDIAAAILLATGFTAALIFAAPAAIIVSYFVCVLASATYLSDSAFGKYQEKCLVVKQQEQARLDAKIAVQEMQAARNDFILSMVKYSTVPLVLVVTFTICWPAAIVLTVAYLGLFDGVASKVMEALSFNKTTEEVDENLQENGSFCCC